MVVAVATEARGVATVAVAMRAVAMVAAVADGADVLRAMRQRAPPPSVARTQGQPQPHRAAETAQPCRLRLVPQPDTPAGCSLLSSCARVWHRALGVRCLSESLAAAVRRLSKRLNSEPVNSSHSAHDRLAP